MDVQVRLSRVASEALRPEKRDSASVLETTRLREGTLEHLFQSLAKSHPELAPLLEGAPEASDLEIRVNDEPISHGAQNVRLREGDNVSLFILEP